MARTNKCPNCSWILPRVTPYKNKKNNPFACPDCSVNLVYSSKFDSATRYIIPLFIILFLVAMRYINSNSTGFVDQMRMIGIVVSPIIVLFTVGFITMPWTDRLQIFDSEK